VLGGCKGDLPPSHRANAEGGQVNEPLQKEPAGEHEQGQPQQPGVEAAAPSLDPARARTGASAPVTGAPALPGYAAPEAESPPEGPARSISASGLVKLLKSRNELRALTVQTAGRRFSGLVPWFGEKARDEDRWEFEGVNETGLVRSVTVRFGARGEDSDGWVFDSVSVRLHPEDPGRTFQEIRRAANAALKKPKWLDLSARDRTAWSLGDGWELVAAVLEDGDIHLRSGRPARP
jgi:hypothetical protein